MLEKLKKLSQTKAEIQEKQGLEKYQNHLHNKLFEVFGKDGVECFEFNGKKAIIKDSPYYFEMLYFYSWNGHSGFDNLYFCTEDSDRVFNVKFELLNDIGLAVEDIKIKIEQENRLNVLRQQHKKREMEESQSEKDKNKNWFVKTRESIVKHFSSK